MTETFRDDQADPLDTKEESKESEAKVTLNPVLTRLIEEVRQEKAEGPHAYNRMHNRHNRSR